MRALTTGLLVLGLLSGVGCTDSSLQGECVPGTDYGDEPTIIPSVSPFVFCPISPVPPNNVKKGNLLLNNCGRRPLTISAVTISNEGSAEVFKDAQLPEGVDTVNPGESVPLLFVYEAVDTAEHSGEITVSSNAANFPELKIGVAVRADEPFDGGFCTPVGGGASDAGSED